MTRRRGLCGIVLGCALLVLAIGAVVAVPNYVEARKNGNETAAIGALGRISTAQSYFRESDKERDGNLDYGSLRELALVDDGRLIDAVLGSGTYKGYVYECSYGASTSEFIWFATARPVEPGVTGDRFFATNHEGVLFYTSKTAFTLNTVDCTIPPGVQPT